MSENLKILLEPPPGRATRFFRATGALALTAGVAASVVVGGNYLSVRREPPPRFHSEKVTRDTVSVSIATTGELAPRRRADVTSPISGTVRQVLAQVGSHVRADQVLARLDPETLAADRQISSLGMANASVVLDLARQKAKRAEANKSLGLISMADYESVQSELKQAELSVRVARASLRKADLALEQSGIRAPMSGYVIARNVEEGQSVSPGGTPPLFVIAGSPDRMKIEAHVVEADIGKVKAGQGATFTVDALPEREFEAQVEEIADIPVNDTGVVSYSVTLGVKEPGGVLKPGMTANISIVMERRADVLKVPNAALSFDLPSGLRAGKRAGGTGLLPAAEAAQDEQPAGVRAQEARVYVLSERAGKGGAGPGLQVEPVPITTGLSDGRYTEVISGLGEGDRVVVGVDLPEPNGGIVSRIPSLFGMGEKKK